MRGGVHPAWALTILALGVLAPVAVAAQSGSLAAVQSRGYVRVCADPDNLPFSSAEGPTPGFEVEVARLVAGGLGVEAEFRWVQTWIRPLAYLRRADCDLFMGLPSSRRFLEANSWIAVSRPYYTMVHALVVRPASGVRGTADLRGRRVAVDAGRPSDYYLVERGIERALYKRQEAVFQAVERGEVSAALLPLPIASWLARGNADLVVLPVAEPSLEVALGIGSRREDETLTAAIDSVVGRLLADGAIHDVLSRYRAIPAP